MVREQQSFPWAVREPHNKAITFGSLLQNHPVSEPLLISHTEAAHSGPALEMQAFPKVAMNFQTDYSNLTETFLKAWPGKVLSSFLKCWTALNPIVFRESCGYSLNFRNTQHFARFNSEDPYWKSMRVSFLKLSVSKIFQHLKSM